MSLKEIKTEDSSHIPTVQATIVSDTRSHYVDNVDISDEIEADIDPATGLIIESDKDVTVSKTAAGAAIAGAVLGTCILGPIGGIIVGGASAYAT